MAERRDIKAIEQERVGTDQTEVVDIAVNVYRKTLQHLCAEARMDNDIGHIAASNSNRLSFDLPAVDDLAELILLCDLIG